VAGSKLGPVTPGGVLAGPDQTVPGKTRPDNATLDSAVTGGATTGDAVATPGSDAAADRVGVAGTEVVPAAAADTDPEVRTVPAITPAAAIPPRRVRRLPAGPFRGEQEDAASDDHSPPDHA